MKKRRRHQNQKSLSIRSILKMVKLPEPLIQGLLSSPLDFSNMIDEIPVGVCVLDTELRVVYFNRAFEALTGTSLSTSYGVPCRFILRSRHCTSSCPAEGFMPEEKSRSCESEIINSDRQKLPVRITLSTIHNSKNGVAGYIETVEDLRTVEKLSVKKSAAYSFEDIVGRSPQMESIFQTLPVLAQSDASILITGETGTGKDLVAEAVHQISARASGPFIKINCGALPETLLESEIFGHQKGAFTGAVENKPGRFKLAHNGTIFLTEIGDLPLSLQVKLLTFLDDKMIYPLGSTKGFRANVRMVAATHRNLEKMVTEGLFRKDLLFRLNVARVHMPPLRERTGDIRLLLDHFINRYAEQFNRPARGFSKRALDLLVNYGYEGNVRELKNIVEYAMNISSGDVVLPEHLPAYIHDFRPCEDPGKEKGSFAVPDTAGESVGVYAHKKSANWHSTERAMILEALVRAKGIKKDAAQLLGWGRGKLWRKMKQHEI